MFLKTKKKYLLTISLTVFLYILLGNANAIVSLNCAGKRVTTISSNEPSLSCSNVVVDASGNSGLGISSLDLRTGKHSVTASVNNTKENGLTIFSDASIFSENFSITGEIPNNGIDVFFNLALRGNISSPGTNNQIVRAGFANLLSTAVNSVRPNSNDRSAVSLGYFDNNLIFNLVEDEPSFGNLSSASSFFTNLITSTTVFPDTDYISLITQVQPRAGDPRFIGQSSASFFADLSITTPIGINLVSESGNLLTPTAVPAPSTFLLLVTGIIGLFSTIRSTKKDK